MLHEFISQHRQELIERARAKVALRPPTSATADALSNGVPIFLTQLADVLEREALRSDPDGSAMGSSATRHGGDLLRDGFSIGQVVHDYGDLCQAITELAVELRVPIANEEFHTLNRCLDDAIAHAVTEYARRAGVDESGAEVRRQGFFAHELRNYLGTAVLALEAVKSGRVGVAGSTFGVLERSLHDLGSLVDRAVSEVRLASGTHYRERVRVAEFIAQAQLEHSIATRRAGQHFTVELVDRAVFVDVDRQLFASALSNLLQNAFKFTQPYGHVRLRTCSASDRVWIEIEDECGGLRPGIAEAIFAPFEQKGANRTGLGLGLTISRKAIEADGGTISVRNVPAQGCIFVIEMPRAADAPHGGAQIVAGAGEDD